MMQMINLSYSMLTKAPSGRPTMTEASEERFIKEFMVQTLPDMLNNSRRAASTKQCVLGPVAYPKPCPDPVLW